MEGFRSSSELSTPKGGGVHLGISGVLSQRTQPMKSGKLVRRKTWRSKSEHVLFSFSAVGGARRQRVVPPGTVGNTSDVWVASPWFSGPKPSEFPYNPKSSWFFGYWWWNTMGWQAWGLGSNLVAWELGSSVLGSKGLLASMDQILCCHQTRNVFCLEP